MLKDNPGRYLYIFSASVSGHDVVNAVGWCLSRLDWSNGKYKLMKEGEFYMPLNWHNNDSEKNLKGKITKQDLFMKKMATRFVQINVENQKLNDYKDEIEDSKMTKKQANNMINHEATRLIYQLFIDVYKEQCYKCDFQLVVDNSAFHVGTLNNKIRTYLNDKGLNYYRRQDKKKKWIEYRHAIDADSFYRGVASYYLGSNYDRHSNWNGIQEILQVKKMWSKCPFDSENMIINTSKTIAWRFVKVKYWLEQEFQSRQRDIDKKQNVSKKDRPINTWKVLSFFGLALIVIIYALVWKNITIRFK